MDALFIVVAELLIVPLILWALIALELTVGVAASVYSIFVGRRSPTEAVRHSWRGIRRRLLWSLIFLSAGLLLADLVFFDAIVNLALGSADDREDLDVGFSHAEGSFILGRVELHQLTLEGVRGGHDPSARFSLAVDELVIDIDTSRLLAAAFAVEELTLDGVRGSFDRLRPRDARRDEDDGIAREFTVERLHVGDALVELRDHTHTSAAGAPRELEIAITELDLGPVASESVIFDLLYRARGRGSVSGHEFVLTSIEAEAGPQSTLEVRALPLDALAEPLERAAGVRAGGSADLIVTNTYLDDPPEPRVELGVALRLRELELEAGADASVATRLMLQVAERELGRLGSEFPLAFEITLLRSELLGLRSLAESGIIELVSEALVGALREQLTRRGPEAEAEVEAEVEAEPGPDAEP